MVNRNQFKKKLRQSNYHKTKWKFNLKGKKNGREDEIEN